jgi:site-specific recombinase XerD
MAKAPVVEEGQFRHAIKVAAVTGQTPARDAALLCVLYGTGMTATELAQLEVADVLDGATASRRTFAVRLHRRGYDLRHIREVLGLASLSATKHLVEGDPVDLGRIVAKVI